MENLRKMVQQILSETYSLKEDHYTTWKNIDLEEGVAELEDVKSEIINKLSKQLGIAKFAPLGSGTQGYAYYIPNNKVLKITTDKSEAAEAFKIKGKKFKHLANVYEVYALQGKYNGIYVIISELLGKLDSIDEGKHLLEKYMDSEFGYSTAFFFEDYSNGSVSKDEIKEYIKGIQKFYDSSAAKTTLWFMNGMLGIIDDIRRNRIHSTDWGTSNIGIKKDGNLAMYDLGYGDPNVPDNVQNIELDEFISPKEYPEFTDTQFNPLFKNRPYPPQMNMNALPLSEEETLSIDELNKKELPYKYPEMIDDFIREKTEGEIREIAPTIDLNQKPIMIVRELSKNYFSLFDNFAEWIYEKKKNNTTFSK